MTKPTPKQRKAAKLVLNNMMSDRPIPTGQILANIGYSKGITETPSMVTESVGFKQALRELGLTEELITSSLVEDIRDKPKFRIQELKLGADILGMIKREEEPQRQTGNTYNFILSPDMRREVREMEERIKERLINGNAEETKKDVDAEQ